MDTPSDGGFPAPDDFSEVEAAARDNRRFQCLGLEQQTDPMALDATSTWVLRMGLLVNLMPKNIPMSNLLGSFK